MKMLHTKKQKGFGLIELIMSSGILLVVASAIAVTLIAVLKMNSQNLNTTIATEIVQTVLEKSNYSTNDVGNLLNMKPSECINDSGFNKFDDSIAIDITTTQISPTVTSQIGDPSFAQIREIKIKVYSGLRNGTLFNNKKFITQAIKRVQL